ncbi:hypothetical protein BDV93DRAFT_521060 [Ceratobasidium sp. AG-I]|nr:hypothetical protein BDV93DRAFT_521060 [Ceratobasidium sp. AG-I]
MSSAPSRIAVNWSLGALKENRNLAAIRFPLGWDSRAGPVFAWYEHLSCTKFTSVQHRKEREFPFYHEFLCVKLTNGNLCRFERFGDPDARTEALTEQGSLAHDLAEILPTEHLAVLDEISDVLEEVSFPCELDLMDVLEICYNIQRDKQTRTYTLQRYNCYFFCWCVLLLLVRKVTPWENGLSFSPWHQVVRQLESDLFKAAATDQDSLVFLLCGWLAPNTHRLKHDVIESLCNEYYGSHASILGNLRRRVGLHLWGANLQEVCCEQSCSDIAIAAAEPQVEMRELRAWVAKIRSSRGFKPGLRVPKSVLSLKSGLSRAFTKTTEKEALKAADSDAKVRALQKCIEELVTGDGDMPVENVRDLAQVIALSDGGLDDWGVVWSQAMKHFLGRYLAPLVLSSILSHTPRLSRPSPEKSGMDEHIQVSQFQQDIRARIAAHASRVERMGLGFASNIRSDVEGTVERVWQQMTMEKYKKKALRQRRRS